MRMEQILGSKGSVGEKMRKKEREKRDGKQDTFRVNFMNSRCPAQVNAL